MVTSPQIPSFLRRSWRAFAAALLTAVALASLAPEAAAPRPARIEGHVTGEGGTPLRGAHVTLDPVEPRAQLHEAADLAGAFAFEQVPPGSYRVAVDYEALHASSDVPLEFEAGKSYTLDLPMVPPSDAGAVAAAGPITRTPAPPSAAQ